MSPPVAGRVTELALELAAELAATATRPWTLMEVCGGQTHAILRWGLDQLLPPGLRLIHGPGCPVCVTPAERIDAALALAAHPEVILCSYGDMLRVPGSGTAGAGPAAATDLLGARAAGGDVRGARTYYPYGELWWSEGFVDNYGYTGQEMDEETGLNHFRFRYYDSTTGRWASPYPSS